jgi:acetylornithine deacetylase
MDVIQLALDLINIESVTGNEAAVAERIETICAGMRLHVERQRVSDRRWNLLANWTSDTDVLFCSHLDTVPPHVPGRMQNDGFLYGRGACDTKGIIAAMLGAGEKMMRDGLTPSYLFVVGEETDSAGAKAAAATGRKARYIIVGEPTENQFAHAHKGMLSYSLLTRGTTGHSGYPERGTSAIHVLLDILEDLRAADWGRDPAIGEATTNIGLIHGGIAPNVLAETASATVVHRIVDSCEARLLQVREIVNGRAEFVVHAQNNPQRMYVPTGEPSIAVSYGTDIPYVRSIGTPLLIGPGSIHDAHTAQEKISIAQIHAAVDRYAALVAMLLKA